MVYETTDFGEVNLNSYLSDVVDLGLSTEDWTPALQHANDDIVASGQSKTIVIPQNIQISTTFQWNVSCVSLKGNGIVINVNINNDQYFGIVGGYPPSLLATNTSSGSSSTDPSSGSGAGGDPVTVSSPTFGGASQATVVMEGIQLIGKPVPTCKGLCLTGGNDGTGAHNLSLREVCIQGFIYGISYENACYMISHYNCDVVSNQYALVSQPTFWNSGERISFINCNIVNNQNGLWMDNSNADFYFFGCSLDFHSNSSIYVKNGCAFFEGCHIENYISDYSNGKYPYIVGDPSGGNGATVVIKGGKVSFTNPDTNTTLDYVFLNNASGKGGLVLENVHLFGLITSTGKLVGGTGYTDIRNVFGYDVMDDVLMSHAVNNLLVDGGFEQGSVLDDIYLYEDSQSVQPYSQTGANIALSVSTDMSHSGSQSLKLAKVGSGLGSAMLTVPVEKGSFPSVEFFYNKDANLTGSVSIAIGYFKLNNKGQQTGLVVSGSSSIDLSTLTDWTKWSGNTNRLPYWATHFFVLFSLSNTGAGNFYVDDLVVTQL